MQISVTTIVGVLSLSARRAWIEMQISVTTIVGVLVALRKESVDRNSIALANIRAYTMVALRKESVDRNLFLLLRYIYNRGRSPQGERG